jgi:histidine triad (HIT) family protein
MTFQADCIFCQIIAGNAPAARVYEDERLLAFMDLHQRNPGHTLIIPKAHFRNIYDIQAELAGEIASFSVRLARALKEAFQPDGMSSFQSSELAALQSVFHYHLHLIPRYTGDDLAAHFRDSSSTAEERQAYAEGIKQALQL